MNRTARRFVYAALFAGLVVLWPQPAQAAQKVLRVWLHGQLLEAPPQEFDFFTAMEGEKPRSLRELVKTLDRAAHDEDIAGIVLIVDSPVMSLAQAEEVTRAFKDFRAKGKKIYCYLDEAGNLAYALACAADHITLSEKSELSIVGLNGSMMFYKGLLDKIGVQADMLHCGAYKSALEPFTRTEPSKEAAENVNWLLDGIYARWLQLIADGRKLPLDQVKAAVDTAPLPAEQALKLKLVDEVASFPAFKQTIHKDFGQDVEVLKRLEKKDEFKIDFENPFAIFGLFNKLMEKSAEKPKPGLGLIYIDGGIAMGKSQPSLFGGGGTVGSDTIRAAFERAREDTNIKAVVVRVDSPGGSALASDIIWEAETRCGKEKPVVVSMGGVAGSGGYYVAIPGEVIFAEESTITGSIGVVGGKLVWKELMQDKLGITTTEFTRGARAGLMSPNRPWTDAERGWMQTYMDGIYTQFKDRVKQSRGERIKGDLEQLAGGRVYTGKQALEHGLVDKLGGLSDALAYAAKKANLGDKYELYVLPKPLDLVEVFKRLMGEETEDEFEISLRLGVGSDPLLRAVLPLLRQLAPQQTQDVIGFLRNAVILNREHVGCFMPSVSLPR